MGMYKHLKLHPYMCYRHDLGWAMAYTMDDAGVITNRAIVNQTKKTFVRTYTASSGIATGHSLQNALEDMGYKKVRGWEGCKLQPIKIPQEYLRDVIYADMEVDTYIDGISGVVVPYIDGKYDCVDLDTLDITDKCDGNTVPCTSPGGSAIVPVMCRVCGNAMRQLSSRHHTEDGIICAACVESLNFCGYYDENNKLMYRSQFDLTRIVEYSPLYSRSVCYALKEYVVWSNYYKLYMDKRDAVWSYIHSSYISKRTSTYSETYGWYGRV